MFQNSDIDIQVGRTGALTLWQKLTPSIWVELLFPTPHYIMKMKLKEKDIRIGDTVLVERAGDVIPHIVSVDLKKEKKITRIYFPRKMPVV